MIIISLYYFIISENISRVEHILVILQQAGYEYVELSHVKGKVQQLHEQPSLDQQERETL